MSKSHQASRLNVQAFANEGVPLTETTLLQDMERIAVEAKGLQPDSSVTWQASAETRPGSGPEADLWLHLQAQASLPLICQRCMGGVAVALEVDQWYRFVASEEIAMAQDDEAEEDLLVMEPQFDLLALLEDELLMALPLVPMHTECPTAPAMRAGDEALAAEVESKPNPFAVLSGLIKKND